MSVSALVTEDSKVNLWLTQFDPEFNRNMFLYHYTSFENACKILYDESLRFSSLSRSNDTLESKPKIKAKNINNEQDLKRIFEHFDKINKSQIQLLCFSKDLSIEINQINPSKIYDDYTGRGFALPRMWAQYGHNNSGVCFIINKNKLLALREQSKRYKKQIIYCDDVKYKLMFDAYSIPPNDIKELCEFFSDANAVLDYEFLLENREFIANNYFSKLDDWSQENEYRLLAFNDSPVLLTCLKEILSGIVIGESMTDVNSKIIHR